MALVHLDEKKLDAMTIRAEKRLLAIAFEMERAIKKSFPTGGGTGEHFAAGTLYKQKYKTAKGNIRTKTHKASAWGQPPAVDTGRLRASISVAWSGGHQGDGARGGEGYNIADAMTPPSEKPGVFRVVVGTNVESAEWLELGTSRIKMRPFLRPVFNKYKPQIIAIMKG